MDKKSEDKIYINAKEIGIENDQILSLLISSISNEVYQKIEEKESKARNLFVGVSSLVLVIVLSLSGYLVNQILDSTVERKLEEAQGETLKRSIFLVEVAALDVEARSMRESDGYTDTEAESIIRKIDRLYREGVATETDPKLLNENIEKLIYSVSSAILSFGQAGRVDYLLELERKATLVAQESDEVPVVMAVVLGEKLLQDPLAPESWNTGGVSNSDYRKFNDYLKKAADKGYPELFILYNFLLGSLDGMPDPRLDNLLSDLNDLSDSDLANFKRRLNSIIDKDGSAKESRASDRAMRAIKKNAEKSEILSQFLGELS